MSRAQFRLLVALAAAVAMTACARHKPRTVPEPAGRAPAPIPTAAASDDRALASLPILEYLRTRELMVPVDGVRVGDLVDTFRAGRGGGRPHNAHDIMAPRGTPVLAADDGRILRVASNELGGLTIYATDPLERLVYYYAHLDGYARGVRAGVFVRKGDLLGYVGHTGNASPQHPHLHFQVAELRDITRHWEGDPVDALHYFVFDGRRRR